MDRLEQQLRRWPWLHKPLCRMVGHHIIVETQSVDDVITLHAHCRSCLEELQKPVELRNEYIVQDTLDAIKDITDTYSRMRDFTIRD